jgi:transposase
MPRPLSIDLRQRIIRAWQRKKLTIVELAERFGVGEATVKRLKRTFRETGGIAARPHAGGCTPIIGPDEERLVEGLVQRHPDWSEDQYAKALAEDHGVVASAVTVGRAVRRLGYSVKKRRSSPRKPIDQRSSSEDERTSPTSGISPLRVWFLWTKPVRTRR